MEQIEAIGQVLSLLKMTNMGPAPLLVALEAGEVRTSADGEPPATGEALLDAASMPSPEWWTAYRDASQAGLRAPTDWALWLHNAVTAPQAELIAIVDHCLEIERQAFLRKQIKGRLARSWSDLEAVAWIASHDEAFAGDVRAFAHQPDETRAAGRAAGLRYLRFKIALRFCNCGAHRPLRPIHAEGACSCLPGIWDRLVDAVAGGLQSTCLNETFTSPRGPEALHGGRFVAAGHAIQASLFSVDGDVLFGAEGVKDILPKAEGSTEAVRMSYDEVEAWCLEWLSGHHGNEGGYNGMDKAWGAFRAHPRAEGLSRDDVFRPAFKSAKRQ